jgi:CheY-like chemotaxis protein
MKKILIIEDDDIIRENISDALNLYNYQIFTAINGKDGLQLAIKMSPDLILCDIKIPLLNGYEVLEALKNDENTQLIPFIFISAKSYQEDIQKGMNLGAVDYIIKPFLLLDLIKILETKLIISK